MSIQCTCPQCGSAYATIPSQLKVGKGKYCSTACYYAAARGRARPGSGPRSFTPEQFWVAFREKTRPEGDCLIWIGKRQWDRKGDYGLVWVGPRATRRRRRAHRVSLERKLGRPIRAGFQANHTCDRMLCVAEDHLYEGTQQQNVDDRIARGRSRHPRGEDHGSAKLTDVQVGEIKLALRCGAKQQALADRYGVSNQLISALHRGKLRTDIV